MTVVLNKDISSDLFCEFRKVYSALSDQQSRDIYIAMLNYYVSGNDTFWQDSIEQYYTGDGRYTRRDLIDFLETVPKDKPVILYGVSTGIYLYLNVWKEHLNIEAFCDRNAELQETGFLGNKVISPEELPQRKDVNVIVTSVKFKTEILHNLDEMGFPMDNVYCAPHSGICESVDEQYFDESIIRFDDQEVFVDGGCCDLGTSLLLRQKVPKVKVYAFEPDEDSYKKCLARKEEEHFDNAKVINTGLWDCKTTLSFEAERGLGCSRISENGSITIKVDRMDDCISPSEKITFIKLDLEGSEYEALKGAERIIRNDRPKMAISLYHRADDLILIPGLIMSYVNDYDYYIRYYRNELTETVLYAVPK